MNTVYLVYDNYHDFRGVFGTKERAKQEVERISIIEHGCRTDDEIWANGEEGNELCYYREEQVIYD